MLPDDQKLMTLQVENCPSQKNPKPTVKHTRDKPSHQRSSILTTCGQTSSNRSPLFISLEWVAIEDAEIALRIWDIVR